MLKGMYPGMKTLHTSSKYLQEKYGDFLFLVTLGDGLH